MRRRLPPLNALRAFEAAARHMSFTRAADELSVTQGAISRQVKALENHLEVQLFQRGHGTLIITDQGRSYMAALGTAFSIIGNATLQLARHGDEGPLNVRVLPSLAMRWLIPRLYEFQTAHPRIEVRITTSLRPGDFARDDVDVVFGLGADKADGLDFDLVMEETLVVVCSASLLGQSHPLRKPSDLAHHMLLHALPREEAWSVWLQAVGDKRIDPSAGSRFEHYYFVLQAAAAGLGVAAAPWPLVQDDLASGNLVAPFDIAVPTGDAYFLIYPAGRRDWPKVQQFRAWVLEIAQREGHKEPKRIEELTGTQYHPLRLA